MPGTFLGLHRQGPGAARRGNRRGGRHTAAPGAVSSLASDSLGVGGHGDRGPGTQSLQTRSPRENPRIRWRPRSAARGSLPGPRTARPAPRGPRRAPRSPPALGSSGGPARREGRPLYVPSALPGPRARREEARWGKGRSPSGQQANAPSRHTAGLPRRGDRAGPSRAFQAALPTVCTPARAGLALTAARGSQATAGVAPTRERPSRGRTGPRRSAPSGPQVWPGPAVARARRAPPTLSQGHHFPGEGRLFSAWTRWDESSQFPAGRASCLENTGFSFQRKPGFS